MKNTLLICLVSSLIFSCGKYEDGPNFSLITKKKRLVGKWKLEKIKGPNYDFPFEYDYFTFTFDKNGDWEYHSQFQLPDIYNSGKSNDDQKGKWEWQEEKKEIEIKWYTNYSSGLEEYDILKLTKTEFILEDKNLSIYSFVKD